MQDSVSVRTPAKINLSLDILGKRYDGYHFVKTIMQTVSLFDEITIEKTDTKNISIFCDTEGIPCDEKNLCHKAAIAFYDFTHIAIDGIKITIDKQIPAMAGLAGGSSDAAGTIFALDKIYRTKLSIAELCDIAEKVGADVPFCIQGGTALAEGVGDILNELPNIPECYIVIVKPDFNISTPEAYTKFDELDIAVTSEFDDMIAAIATQDITTISSLLFNSLELATDYDEIKQIKETMTYQGALGTLMSGSGSAVYGIFEKKKTANKCADEMEEKYENVFVCTPHNSGPIII